MSKQKLRGSKQIGANSIAQTLELALCTDDIKELKKNIRAIIKHISKPH